MTLKLSQELGRPQQFITVSPALENKWRDFWNQVDLCRVNPTKNAGYEDEYDVAVEETLRLLADGASAEQIVRVVVDYYGGEYANVIAAFKKEMLLIIPLS